MKVPCLNCPDRHFRCHGECDKYAEFNKSNRVRLENMRAIKDTIYFDYEVQRPLRRSKVR